MSRKQRKTLIRILVAALLVLAVSVWSPENRWLCLVAFLIPYSVAGWDVVWSAFRNILRGRVLDERFLMTVATVGAFALGEYREAVAVMLFYQIGEWFQSLAVGKSRRNIAELMAIRPETAVVLRNGEEITVSPEEVEIGERFLV
ncbi:MAG: heavy metal translocating P-type ATPase, partial [Clostridia bacterium]|nr:heavy metal translocating P-type ATPase [Clostridia bacterium]